MNTALFLIVFFAIFTLAIGGVIYGFIAAAIRKKAMNAYATAYGWTPIVAGDQTVGPMVPQRLVGQGDWHSYHLGYQLTVNDRPGVVFEYTYTTQTRDADGNTQEYSKSFTILAFQMPGLTPLEVLKHSVFAAFKTFGRQEDRVKLEGNFNNDFDVFMPDGGQVNALTIMTPDTMALIQDNGKDFNLQIQGDWVVIDGDDKYLNVNNIDRLISYANRLQPELAQKLHQYS